MALEFISFRVLSRFCFVLHLHSLTSLAVVFFGTRVHLFQGIVQILLRFAFALFDEPCCFFGCRLDGGGSSRSLGVLLCHHSLCCVDLGLGIRVHGGVEESAALTLGELVVGKVSEVELFGLLVGKRCLGIGRGLVGGHLVGLRVIDEVLAFVVALVAIVHRCQRL